MHSTWCKEVDRIHSLICLSLHRVLKDPSSTVVQGHLVRNQEAMWVPVWGRVSPTLHSAPLASLPALTSGSVVPSFLLCLGLWSWLYLWSFQCPRWVVRFHLSIFMHRTVRLQFLGNLSARWRKADMFLIPSLLPWVSPAPCVYWGALSCFPAAFCGVWCEGHALVWYLFLGTQWVVMLL